MIVNNNKLLLNDPDPFATHLNYAVIAYRSIASNPYVGESKHHHYINT